MGDVECDAGVTSACQEFLVECSSTPDDRIKSADLLWQQFHLFGDIKSQRYDVCEGEVGGERGGRRGGGRGVRVCV